MLGLARRSTRWTALWGLALGCWGGCAGRALPLPDPDAGVRFDAAPVDAAHDLARSADLSPADMTDLAVDQELPPPRSVAPLSTSRVTSRRPTLHWQLPVGADGARVELCRERACAHAIPVIPAPGTSAPPVERFLPAHGSVVFWQPAPQPARRRALAR